METIKYTNKKEFIGKLKHLNNLAKKEGLTISDDMTNVFTFAELRTPTLHIKIEYIGKQ